MRTVLTIMLECRIILVFFTVICMHGHCSKHDDAYNIVTAN